jgi:ketosteroid isomerase-like protein
MDDARLQQLFDEKEIVDVMTAYTTALDTKDWDLLASSFTPDGDANFGNLAGVGALDSPQAIVELCRGALQDLQATQHLQGNFVVEVDGNTARSSCYLQANHFLEGAPGGSMFVVWGKYRDQFVRTGDGWKIKHRNLDTISTGGNQNLFAEAAEMAGRTPA